MKIIKLILIVFLVCLCCVTCLFIGKKSTTEEETILTLSVEHVEYMNSLGRSCISFYCPEYSVEVIKKNLSEEDTFTISFNFFDNNKKLAKKMVYVQDPNANDCSKDFEKIDLEANNTYTLQIEIESGKSKQVLAKYTEDFKYIKGNNHMYTLNVTEKI